MKLLSTEGLTELITKIKSSFIKNTDVVSATTLDIDSAPTASSNNLVTSGGVHTAISGKEDSTNKVTAWSATTTNTKYPSEKLVKDSLDEKQATLTAGANITIQGNVISASAGLPAGTAAGNALVWNGTEWAQQDGYGYSESSGQAQDIQWDGDTTGKQIITVGEGVFGWCKVSDLTPSGDELTGGIISSRSSTDPSETYTFTIGTDALLGHDWSEMLSPVVAGDESKLVYCYAGSGMHMLIAYLALTITFDIGEGETLDMVVPSTGIYFNYMYGTTTRLLYGSSATVHKIDAKYIPSTSWGGITGIISNQEDLQLALDAKVSRTRTVNGHPLSSDVTVTAADVGAYPITGGVVNGSVSIAYGNTLNIAGKTLLLYGNGLNAYLGNSSGHYIKLLTSNDADSDIIHLKGGTDYVMYDANNLVPNVSNPTTNLTSLLIGNTKYSVSTTPTWGSITGTLSNQTDLQTALNEKSSVTANPTTTTSDLTGITIDGTSYKISGMPDGTAASQGLVWDGTQWVKQAGYAYGTSGSQVTITWDGDTTGRESFADAYYKVSDNVITSAQFLASTYVVNGTTCTISEVDENEGMLIPTPVGSDLGPIVLTVPMENLTAGIYFCKMDSTNFVSSMTYAGAGELHTFDPQLLPLDSTPTSESANGVTSGGVYNALNDKEDIEFNGAPTALTEAVENILVGNKTYTFSGLPSDATAGQAVVHNGTDWLKQSGYGYTKQTASTFDVNWDGDTTGKQVVSLYNTYVKVSDYVPDVEVGDTVTGCVYYASLTSDTLTGTVSLYSGGVLQVNFYHEGLRFDAYIVKTATLGLTPGTYFYAYNIDSSTHKPLYYTSRLISTEPSLEIKQIDNSLYANRGVDYITVAPTAANTDGLKIAYLTSEPATKYDGWIYLIKE